MFTELVMNIVIHRMNRRFRNGYSQCFFHAFPEYRYGIIAVLTFPAEKYQFGIVIIISEMLQENLLGRRVIEKSTCIKWFMHPTSIAHFAINCRADKR